MMKGPASAHEVVADEDVASEGPAEEAEEKGDATSEVCQRAAKSRAMWCSTCNCVKSFAHSHASRARGKHVFRHATEPELEDHFRRIDAATARCEASAGSASAPPPSSTLGDEKQGGPDNVEVGTKWLSDNRDD